MRKLVYLLVSFVVVSVALVSPAFAANTVVTDGDAVQITVPITGIGDTALYTSYSSSWDFEDSSFPYSFSFSNSVKSNSSFSSDLSLDITYNWNSGYGVKFVFGFLPTFSPITEISKVEFLDSFSKTGVMSITSQYFYQDLSGNSILSNTNQIGTLNGGNVRSWGLGNTSSAAWIVVSQFDDYVKMQSYYTVNSDSDVMSAVVSWLFGEISDPTVPIWKGNASGVSTTAKVGNFNSCYAFGYDFSSSTYSRGHVFNLDAGLTLLPMTLSTGTISDEALADAKQTTIIVNGFANLESAIETSVASGVTQLEEVIVRETQALSDAFAIHTDTIINVGSEEDVSLDNSELTSVQEREQIIRDKIKEKLDSNEVITQIEDVNLSSVSSDNVNDSTFEWLSDTMQRIFDMGFGEVIILSLTFALSMFIIGRRT